MNKSLPRLVIGRCILFGSLLMLFAFACTPKVEAKRSNALILPKREISTTADNFLEFHEEWFQDTTWSFETKILNMDVSEKLALATVESMYRESERNGKPYFNKMHISYGLQKINDQWYVIKDHASSLEKTEN